MAGTVCIRYCPVWPGLDSGRQLGPTDALVHIGPGGADAAGSTSPADRLVGCTRLPAPTANAGPGPPQVSAVDMVAAINRLLDDAERQAPQLSNEMDQLYLEIRGDFVYYATGQIHSAVNDNERRCIICLDFARVPFEECWYCGDSPSWHHRRCCPDKPQRRRGVPNQPSRLGGRRGV